ncbi:MAG: polyprenyl synthetase family protein [Candidatus Thermoplasmatota archaeon]|nr:polyprenyl synthetase family protein [Candidatus Thermoplasmatota archaeon]
MAEKLNVDEFEAYLGEKSGLIDAELGRFLADSGDIPSLHEGVFYALGLDTPERRRRGKRLRPVLCLLTCESLGGEVQRAIPFAMACEMMHNFLLVHDDIEDRDVMRRGRDSVWVRYGKDHGINIGDYMFAQTYELVRLSLERGVNERVVLSLMDLVTQTVERTGEGQALEIEARRRMEMTLDDYMSMVTAKTGFYLAAPLVGGAILADASPASLDVLRSLGDKIGPIFQIADDIIDLTEGKGRGERGSDIKEGKRSFLVVHVSQCCTLSEREELFRILMTPRTDVTREEVHWVMEIFEKYDAVEAARDKGRELLEEAKAFVRKLPPPLDSNLLAAVEFMLGRKW